jgi:hypothetical protein
MRLFNGRLTRKTLALSKLVAMYRALPLGRTWSYNLARPLKTLRLENSNASQRWLPRSPAMVAGLCLDCLLGSVVPPVNT